MWQQLLIGLFGGMAGGFVHHALYIRPQQLKGAPPVIAGAIQAADQVAIGAVDSALGAPSAPPAADIQAAAADPGQGAPPPDAPVNPFIQQR